MILLNVRKYANVIKFLFTTFVCKIRKKYSNFLECLDRYIANTKLQFRGSLPLRVYLIKERFFCFYLYLITLIDNISIISTFTTITRLFNKDK